VKGHHPVMLMPELFPRGSHLCQGLGGTGRSE